MKSKTNSFKLIISLVLLMLAVLNFIHVSYSYFTATISVNGDLGMSNLKVSFRYKPIDSNTATIAKDNYITLVSSTERIERGNAFGLKIFRPSDNDDEGEYVEISDISIINEKNSCDCYVRFWIEAYLVKNGKLDTATDYGKFFFLTRYDSFGSNNFTRATTAPYCYYIEKKLTSTGSSADASLSLGNELTLKDITKPNPSYPNDRTKDIVVEAVPIDLLGETLQIKISFEAVQTANKAFESVFKVTQEDPKGYYSGWN